MSRPGRRCTSRPFLASALAILTCPSDRPPQNALPAPGQPVSFKTNVNRMKTKKWVEAKKNAYDGDDWGEYDEYDEYGTEQAPPPQPAMPQGPRGYGQQFEQPSRSFTDPQRQGPPQVARRNSFEAGDEHRAFSASMAPPPQDYPQQPPGPAYPAHRQASGAESDISDTPQHRRDFSPSAMPTPLQTRMSPAPGSGTGSPATQFPPRKSSIGQVESPAALSPRDRAPSNPAKALPFIRPADIYRRVEEERQRERASLDSSRPSLDSLSRPREDAGPPQGLQERASSDSLGRSAEAGRSLQPLETVAERKSEYLPDLDIGAQEQGKGNAPAQVNASQPSQQPSLPQIEGISAFDNDFWSSGSRPQAAPATYTPVVSPPDDQGFRSVVDQAFTRSDDQRSMPPTPISKSDSTVSRSNTASTSGISPIMSRVPSSATSALKARNQAGGDGSTPVIAEEASETSTPVSRPTSAAMLSGSHQIPRKPSPSHSRNVSSTSPPRSGLATPSPGESPARSPAIEPQKPVAEPESAQLSTLNPTSPDAMEGGLDGPSPTYATREADIATAMRTSPDNAAPELSAAEKDSQTAFLESHNAASPVADAVSRSRSESPSKGRVQELAGKFGEVSQPRRGSTQSNVSRNSVQSWERSQDNSRPSSPKKTGSPTKEASTARPAAEREISFRPKLPGQWESYATTAATPPAQGEDFGSNKAAASPLEEVDLTPTTAKHPVSANESSTLASDTLAALKAAGAAVGEAIQASVARDTPHQQEEGEERARDHQHRDTLPRPLQLDRQESSVSTIPPTPPAKDTPESEELPPPPPLKEKSPEPHSSSVPRSPVERPTILPQLSTDPSVDDQESDRLRKEIVASLSPLRTSVTPAAEPNTASLLPSGAPVNRESSIFPSEYDSYWADGDRTSPRPSHDLGRNIPDQAHSSTEQPSIAAKSTAQQPSNFTKPSIFTRFSWEEDQGSQPILPEGAAAQAPRNIQQEEKLPSPAVEEAAKEQREPSFQGIPDPYFGPAHSVAIKKPEPLSNSDLPARAPTPPPESAKPVASPIRSEMVGETSPASGLHVVNTDLNPEAVDMPPRLSREVSPASQPPRSSGEGPAATQEQKASEALSAAETAPEPSPTTAAVQESVPMSPTSDKPLGFRDIVTMKSPSERIATYNKTREYWAHADHGLGDWVSSAITANPDLATQSFPSQPILASSGTSRHRPTGSLSFFGKHHGSSSHQADQNAASSQAPTTPTVGPARPGSSPGGPGRSASHHVQSRGKDLLHTAGVLGGKGMTGAKGLFSKGKSRFKGDKVDK